MANGLLAKIMTLFDGDPGVRKVADDPVLSAELLLLFRMILADGTVSESEMSVFRRICREAFGIADESMDGCHRISERVRLRDHRLAGGCDVSRSRP